MSWIIGCFGNKIEKYSSAFQKLDLNSTYNFQNNNYIIKAGGINETICSGKINDNNNFVVAGLGISNKQEKLKFFTVEDWCKVLQSNKFDPKHLNGHFVIIQFSSEKIAFQSDALGMRDLYYYVDGQNILFSTRTDLLVLIKKNNKLNISNFASNWMLNFQLNFNSIFDDIDRIGPGGFLTFANGELEKHNLLWEPNINAKNLSCTFEDELKRFILFPLETNKMSLALSGGLDSRLLFSILNSQELEWTAHSFGEKLHPDVELANKIAENFNIRINNYSFDINLIEDAISKLDAFFSQSPPIIPAYEVLNIYLNREVYNQNKIIIDGCCGEIFRRQYLLGLAVKGKNELINFNSTELFKYFTGFKVDIFKDEVNYEMQNFCLKDISTIKNIMPKVTEENINDWLDLFSIIYKIPNIFSPLQAFADSISVDYIPFVQKDILELNFGISVNQRKNGKLFKEIIKRNSKELSNFPLVKNNVKYPFYFGSIAQRFVLKINNKFGKIYNSRIDQQLLFLLKDYIYDQINSNDFNNFEYYDKQKIKYLVDQFYNGNFSLAFKLNWFLSFEMWRKNNLT
ncbi:MAG: hypothetical protein H6612_02815 [Ignavibacteriales bacterium]|nr:hypothetical protein [Ignavibacteriales bacterium]